MEMRSLRFALAFTHSVLYHPRTSRSPGPRATSPSKIADVLQLGGYIPLHNHTTTFIYLRHSVCTSNRKREK